MVTDGFTAFEHDLPVSPIEEDVIQLMARSGAAYTPTVSVHSDYQRHLFFASKTTAKDYSKFDRFAPYPKGILTELRGGNVPDDALDSLSKLPSDQWIWWRTAQDAPRIAHAVGLVAVGGHDADTPGIHTHWELWTPQMGGLTPMEALRAATINGAIKLGRDQDLGSIEVGKLADLIVLNADPLTDIHNTNNIRYTISNRVVYDAASMTEVYPVYKELPPFFWQTDEEYRAHKAPAPPPLPGCRWRSRLRTGMTRPKRIHNRQGSRRLIRLCWWPRRVFFYLPVRTARAALRAALAIGLQPDTRRSAWRPFDLQAGGDVRTREACQFLLSGVRDQP